MKDSINSEAPANEAIALATDFKVADNDRSEIAEQAILKMFQGCTLKQAAKELSKSKDTVLAHICKSTHYLDLYTRAKVSRAMSLTEDLYDAAMELTGTESEGELKAFDRQQDARKFTIGKYGQHLEKAVNAGLTQVNIQGQEGSRIVIQTAQPVNSPSANQLGDSADGDAIEIES